MPMFLPPILFSVFFALKVFLWSLPIAQVELFAVALPLGIGYFWLVFRCYGLSLTQRRPPAA
jgi:hypothetical protein